MPPRRRRAIAPKTFRTRDTIHVNNLPIDTTKDELEAALSCFGPVKELMIHAYAPYHYRHAKTAEECFTYAFVNFEDPQDGLRCRNSTIIITVRGSQLKFNGRDTKTEERAAFAVNAHAFADSSQESVAMVMPSKSQQLMDEAADRIESTLGGTILVDDIPMLWTAQDFYSHLSQRLTSIKSVLIYEDCDERGLRQGLVQFTSMRVCAGVSSLKYLQLKCGVVLPIQQSEVKSIGLLKRKYHGHFEIYEPTSEEQDHQESEYCNTDQLCNIEREISWNTKFAQLPTYVPANQLEPLVSPADSPDRATPDFTPAASDFTPATDIYQDEGETFRKEPIKYPLCNIGTNFATFAPAIQAQTAALDTATSGTTQYGVPISVTALFSLPTAPSSTIIVDNIGSDGKENIQSDLKRICTRFGRPQSIDMAKSGSTYRAFICYNNPNQAGANFPALQNFYNRSTVKVRFA